MDCVFIKDVVVANKIYISFNKLDNQLADFFIIPFA